MEFIRQLVAFCALMETDTGILGKSRDYIEEKWIHCVNSPDETTLLAHHDTEARAVYEQWFKKEEISIHPAPGAIAPEEFVEEEEPGPESKLEEEVHNKMGSPKSKKGRSKREKVNQDQ